MDMRNWQQRLIAEAPDKAKQLEAFNNTQSDWYVHCPHCGTDLRGTLAQIKAHDCGK